MNPKWQWLTFGFISTVVAVFTIGQVAFTAAQSSLKADAGPDQTAAGTNPVMVEFLGKANVDRYTCDWYNQWNLLRIGDWCNLIFEVNFGQTSKIGTKRIFKLEVIDLDTGQKASYRLTITYEVQQPTLQKVTLRRAIPSPE
jgi:hypothetical protein